MSDDETASEMASSEMASSDVGSSDFRYLGTFHKNLSPPKKRQRSTINSCSVDCDIAVCDAHNDTHDTNNDASTNEDSSLSSYLHIMNHQNGNYQTQSEMDEDSENPDSFADTLNRLKAKQKQADLSSVISSSDSFTIHSPWRHWQRLLPPAVLATMKWDSDVPSSTHSICTYSAFDPDQQRLPQQIENVVWRPDLSPFIPDAHHTSVYFPPHFLLQWLDQNEPLLTTKEDKTRVMAFGTSVGQRNGRTPFFVDIRLLCQIEKIKQFWTASTITNIVKMVADKIKSHMSIEAYGANHGANQATNKTNHDANHGANHGANRSTNSDMVSQTSHSSTRSASADSNLSCMNTIHTSSLSSIYSYSHSSHFSSGTKSTKSNQTSIRDEELPSDMDTTMCCGVAVFPGLSEEEMTEFLDDRRGPLPSTKAFKCQTQMPKLPGRAPGKTHATGAKSGVSLQQDSISMTPNPHGTPGYKEKEKVHGKESKENNKEEDDGEDDDAKSMKSTMSSASAMAMPPPSQSFTSGLTSKHRSEVSASTVSFAQWTQATPSSSTTENHSNVELGIRITFKDLHLTLPSCHYLRGQVCDALHFTPNQDPSRGWETNYQRVSRVAYHKENPQPFTYSRFSYLCRHCAGLSSLVDQCPYCVHGRVHVRRGFQFVGVYSPLHTYILSCRHMMFSDKIMWTTPGDLHLPAFGGTGHGISRHHPRQDFILTQFYTWPTDIPVSTIGLGDGVRLHELQSMIECSRHGVPLVTMEQSRSWYKLLYETGIRTGKLVIVPETLWSTFRNKRSDKLRHLLVESSLQKDERRAAESLQKFLQSIHLQFTRLRLYFALTLPLTSTLIKKLGLEDIVQCSNPPTGSSHKKKKRQIVRCIVTGPGSVFNFDRPGNLSQPFEIYLVYDTLHSILLPCIYQEETGLLVNYSYADLQQIKCVQPEFNLIRKLLPQDDEVLARHKQNMPSASFPSFAHMGANGKDEPMVGGLSNINSLTASALIEEQECIFDTLRKMNYQARVASASSNRESLQRFFFNCQTMPVSAAAFNPGDIVINHLLPTEGITSKEVAKQGMEAVTNMSYSQFLRK